LARRSKPPWGKFHHEILRLSVGVHAISLVAMIIGKVTRICEIGSDEVILFVEWYLFIL
jgi:hypothetical protein